jgi:hypothetical protein
MTIIIIHCHYINDWLLVALRRGDTRLEARITNDAIRDPVTVINLTNIIDIRKYGKR